MVETREQKRRRDSATAEIEELLDTDEDVAWAAEVLMMLVREDAAQGELKDQEDGDERANQQPLAPQLATQAVTSNTQPEADQNGALLVHSKGWKRGEPRPYPQQYHVPTDNQGGTRIMSINFDIDFDDADSVKLANKRRRCTLWRARTKHEIDHLRTATADRPYTPENHAWLLNAFKAWATAEGQTNAGPGPTYAQLADLYNEEFSGENEYRTAASIMAYISRHDDLKAQRAEYPSRITQAEEEAAATAELEAEAQETDEDGMED